MYGLRQFFHLQFVIHPTAESFQLGSRLPHFHNGKMTIDIRIQAFKQTLVEMQNGEQLLRLC